MVSKSYKDEKGKVLEEIQQNGETISEPLDRQAIGETTAEMLRNAKNLEDIKDYLARVHNVDLNK